MLVDEGFDPAYGARPLKRIIQQRVIDPVAMLILQGEFKEVDRIMVAAKDKQIALSKEAPVTV